MSTSDKAHIIASAVLNKFNDWSMDTLYSYVTSVSQGDTASPEKGDEVLFADIQRQLACFAKIEGAWLEIPLNFDLLTNINGLARGAPPDEKLIRSENYVEDFGGEALTDVNELPAGIRKVETELDGLEQAIGTADPNALSASMAGIFCSIITVHPFEDGNGRTARFLVQLALRRSGFHYIELPKYRNDASWRQALDEGTKGDLTKATAYFAERLRKRSKDGRS